MSVSWLTLGRPRLEYRYTSGVHRTIPQDRLDIYLNYEIPQDQIQIMIGNFRGSLVVIVHNTYTTITSEYIFRGCPIKLPSLAL